MGAMARVGNSTEEVIPMEEDRMDRIADVGVDTAQAGDVEYSKATTSPTDGGETVDLISVHDRTSASMEAHTAGTMVTI